MINKINTDGRSVAMMNTDKSSYKSHVTCHKYRLRRRVAAKGGLITQITE